MASFIALYRGDTVGTADLVAVTADPELVRQVAEAMLDQEGQTGDPVKNEMRAGRRRALELVRDEVEEGGEG